MSVALTEIIDNNNDATLSQLCELLEKKRGLRVSTATMGRISHNLDYTFKKRRDPAPSHGARERSPRQNTPRG